MKKNKTDMKKNKTDGLTSTPAASRCSAWLDIMPKLFTLQHLSRLLFLVRQPIWWSLKGSQFILQCRIIFHKSLYRFYLCRKCVVLFVSARLVRFRLFQAERKLIAQYGRDWRLRVFNNECVESLKMFDKIHTMMSNPGTQRPGDQTKDSPSTPKPGSLE
jgi:hypothetical protein